MRAIFLSGGALAEPKILLESADITRALKRVAHEIIERNRGLDNLVLVGIRTRGVPLAERIQAHLQSIEAVQVPVGALDIALHRDDFHLRSAPPRSSQIGFDVSNKVVVLVDDVLFTGRTIRAALDALGDFGRPQAVQLAVLVDRGHRELPIRADFVGKNAPTSREERVQVRLEELDGEDEVVILATEDTENARRNTERN